MKIKIVNTKKLLRSIFIILGILICILLIISNTTLSHGEKNYKKIKICNGDTLWKIAEIEQNTNEYYKYKDIRIIIDNIKKSNNLKNCELQIGQELIIPTI